MSKYTHTLRITELTGDRWPDLTTAQAHGRPALASDLAALMRHMLDTGLLVNVNGRIIPNPERTPKQ